MKKKEIKKNNNYIDLLAHSGQITSPALTATTSKKYLHSKNNTYLNKFSAC